MRWTAWTTAAAILTQTCGAMAAPATTEVVVPVFALHDNGVVPQWVLLGPFPNPEPKVALPGADYRLGFATDFLTSLGGESEAVLTPDTTIPYTEEDGSQTTLTAAVAEVNQVGRIDLKKFYGIGKKMAYGFVEIASKTDQPGYFYFGSNDCAKVWVNGQLVASSWNSGGRAFAPDQDVFTVDLKRGLNRVLVKVEDAGGSAWEFRLEAYDSAGNSSKDAATSRISALKQFQNAEIVPEGGRGFVLPIGPLPAFQWKDEHYVTSLVGETPLTTTWYNAKRHKVREASRPGRYAAVVEGYTPDGLHVRRAFTVYCHAPEWAPPVDRIRTYLHRLPAAYSVKERWLTAADQLDPIGAFCSEGFGGVGHAILLAGWDAAKDLDRPLTVLDTPEAVDAEYHLKLRYELTDTKPAKLAPPRVAVRAVAPVLRVGPLEEAGMKPGTPEKLDAFFTQWYKETGDPFSALIARNGIIILNKSYGQRPINPETAFWMASITKGVTGLLFAQFVDQGLIGIDDPVGKYLPDFPVEGDKAVTLRHCLTHTSGLAGHGEWGGLLNPWLDNVIADGVEYLQPGKVHEYNGMGIDLAGKVMEVVSGKSIYRLLEENFFGPLGLAHASITDLGGGMYCSSEDLARIGQMLENRGAYGHTVFFRPETLTAFMPRDLSEIYPGVHSEWGVGITPMREPRTGAGADGIPADATVLSRNVIGHGAASGSIFRVDLDNHLVIVQTRDDAGPNYDAYAHRLMEILDGALVH